MTIRVVVVDDEKPARDRLKRLLAEHSDFELIGEAADSVEAVTLIDREKPDVVLLQALREQEAVAEMTIAAGGKLAAIRLISR